MMNRLGRRAACVLLSVCMNAASGQDSPAAAGGVQPRPGQPTGVSRPESPSPEDRSHDVVRPTLPEDAAEEVAKAEARIAELEKTGLTAETREQQDAALDEAIKLAERVQAIRQEHQGNTPEAVRWKDEKGQPSEWWEVVEANLKIKHLRLLRGMEGAARADIASLIEMDKERAVLYQRGKYADVHAILERQLVIRRQHFPGDHPDVAMNLSDAAFMRKAMGRLAESEPLNVQALEMRQRLFPGDHPDVATSLNNLASMRKSQGRLAESEPLNIQALEMRQRLFPGDHPDVAMSLNNLASMRKSLGRVAEAEPLFVQALEISQRLFPGDHPGVAACLSNLAGVRVLLGRAPEAEPLNVQALEMYQRLFPGDHPDVATSLNNLASVRKSLGRAAEAEPLHVQALQMRQRLFPGDHPDVAQSLNNLAFLRQSLGRAAEAEPLQIQTLEMFQRLFPRDHPDVATSLTNLALVRQSLGRAAEVEPLYVQALEMFQRLFPRDHPQVATGLSNLAFVRISLGRAAEAEPLYVQALEMRQRLFPGDHPGVANSLCNLAFVRVLLGRAAETEPLYVQALAMTERMRADVVGGAQERASYAGALRLSGIAADYARVLVELNRPTDALNVLERGRSRAALDLLASEPDLETKVRALGDPARAERYTAAVGRERAARSALLDAENRLSALLAERKTYEKTPTLTDETRPAKLAEIDEQKKTVFVQTITRRRDLSDATVAVFTELRGLVPQGNPLTAAEILGALAPHEAILSYAITTDGAIALVATSSGVSGLALAKTKDDVKALRNAADALRETIVSRPDNPGVAVEPTVLAAARGALLPDHLLEALRGVKSLTVIPDGPLLALPMELLLSGVDGLADVSITYAPSATVAIDRRKVAASHAGRNAGAVVLGDPHFGDPPREPDYPKTGVLLTTVVKGENAALAGLQRGDVLLRYSDTPLSTAADLKPAVETVQAQIATRGDTGDRPITVEVWRAGKNGRGETLTLNLVPGKLGVLVDQRLPDVGLRSMAFFDRSADEQKVSITVLEQLRLHDGSLSPLPGSRREAGAIDALLKQAGVQSVLLTGESATAPALRAAIASPTRYLHLATHGMTGNTDRPLEASLALTRPDEPTLDNIGFLTLEEILGRWLGKLNGCEVVTLSACDTGRGVVRGDTAMTLPLGFFVAGAETVVASLWKVDDTATALLMSRFYANLLGQTAKEREIDGVKYEPGRPLPKLAALREARVWLRSLTGTDRDRLVAADADAIAQTATRGEPRPARGPVAPAPQAADIRPFDHPYYYAAFVLYGSDR